MMKVLILSSVAGVTSPTRPPSSTRQYFGSPSHPASVLPSKMGTKPVVSSKSGTGIWCCDGTYGVCVAPGAPGVPAGVVAGVAPGDWATGVACGAGACCAVDAQPQRKIPATATARYGNERKSLVSMRGVYLNVILRTRFLDRVRWMKSEIEHCEQLIEIRFVDEIIVRAGNNLFAFIEHLKEPHLRDGVLLSPAERAAGARGKSLDGVAVHKNAHGKNGLAVRGNHIDVFGSGNPAALRFLHLKKIVLIDVSRFGGIT